MRGYFEVVNLGHGPAEPGRYRKQMFWPFILPIQLTTCIFVTIITIATIAAPYLHRRREQTFMTMFILGMFTYIPSCGLIMDVVDARRFGVFHYASFDNVNDPRVERYLPQAASDITLEKSYSGFRARYRIAKPELDTYLTDFSSSNGKHSHVQDEEISKETPVDLASHNQRYGDLGWPYLNDLVDYSGKTRGNMTVWHSTEAEIAYQEAGYW